MPYLLGVHSGNGCTSLYLGYRVIKCLSHEVIDILVLILISLASGSVLWISTNQCYLGTLVIQLAASAYTGAALLALVLWDQYFMLALVLHIGSSTANWH